MKKNPWEEIDLTVYENHMSLEGVMQLQTMNRMMREQFFTRDVNSVMIFGVAGGNGLEHFIGKNVGKVYGVDINEEYLKKCRQRYPELKGVFEPLCVDLTAENIALPSAELLIANLLIEYIGIEAFLRAVEKVSPEYLSCITQKDLGVSFVSDSPYLRSFDRLREVHRNIDPDELSDGLSRHGYRRDLLSETSLPNGKLLIRSDFSRR